MTIRAQRQDERLEEIEQRLLALEHQWKALIGISNGDKHMSTSRGRFLDAIDKHFNEENLRDAAYELSVDYDSLPAEGKRAKARELILQLEDEGRLFQLTGWLQKTRPNIEWVTP